MNIKSVTTAKEVAEDEGHKRHREGGKSGALEEQPGKKMGVDTTSLKTSLQARRKNRDYGRSTQATESK
jgi:hypothetical protein